MRIPQILILAAAGLPLTAVADSCRYEDELSATIEGRGLAEIEIDARAGALEVEGVEGLERIEVIGLACASDEEYLEEIELRTSTSSDGSTGKVEVRLPNTDGHWGWDDDYAYLDLTVRIPKGMATDIEDSSGSMDVEGVGTTRIEDSSGSIFVWGVEGDLTIDDSSGSIEVRDVHGVVSVDDSSGSIDIEEVVGSVVIERDSSGSIDIEDVEGDVLVRRDSSGSIQVRDITGDFSVLRDGSGGIRHRNVGGRVDLPDDDWE